MIEDAKLTERVERLAKNLFDSDAERQLFIKALKQGTAGRPLKIATEKINPLNSSHTELPEEWATIWQLSEDPNKSYSIDCSSLFMISPLIEVLREPPESLKICDICASPGGKSILTQLISKPDLLISNEVEESRIKALISNFSKHEIKNAVVTSLISKQLIKYLGKSFHVVILDAPCSGQSLISKGVQNTQSLSKLTIEKMSQIQKGLLNDAAKLCTPGGYINYSTCTFSMKENEKVIEWFLRKHPEFEAIEVQHLKEYRSHYSKHPSYRLWPYQNLGSGGFTCLLKNICDEEAEFVIDEKQLQKCSLWQSKN